MVASSKARRAGAGAGAGAVAALVLVLILLAISTSPRKPSPPPIGVGCTVGPGTYAVPLDPSQAGIAATIAGVARHRRMPVQAVAIAYATALQESDLENLPYGDRDSVGVFQQRPSQGWGTRRELLDPVYASTRFFAALAAVPNYLHLQIDQAAQAVQHSADGSAYGQYSGEGAVMAVAFTGHLARGVSCWYGSGTGPRHLVAAGRELTNAFGPLRVSHIADPSMLVGVPHPSAGWAVASWLVSNAGNYGIRVVQYEGYQWTAASGTRGWLRYHTRHSRDSAATVRFG